jgi:pyruvate kinase
VNETRAKIVATVGPASASVAAMTGLARAGADVLRVNGAHETPERLGVLVRRVRAAARRAGRPLAVLVDLPGAKRRVGAVEGGGVDVRPGDRLLLVSRRAARRGGGVPVPAATLAAVRRGGEVLFGDGAVAGRVESVRRGAASLRVLSGGRLSSRTGVHVRGAEGGSVPTRADLLLAAAAARAGADALALSFVRGPEDLRRLRRALEARRLPVPLLVAKLERREGIDRLEEVLEACDGVMVARGDMGLEYGPEAVPGLQKRILEAAARHGRIAITATQMLESMVHATRPTRAEASDVANAVFDGTDAVMLSAETAVGAHPALAVETMDRVLRAAEADPHCPYAGDAKHPSPQGSARRPDRLVVRAAARLAEEASAAAVVVFTRGGHSARRIAKERPRAPVYAFTPDPAVARALLLSWGVRPRPMPHAGSTDGVMRAVLRRLRVGESLPAGARVVLVMGGARDPAGTTSLVKLLTL